MRYVFTPEELTAPSLLLRGLLDVSVQRALESLYQAMVALEGETKQEKDAEARRLLLEQLTFQQQMAWAQQRRYTYAVYTLYRADFLRRQCRWEDALHEAELALPWLQSRVEEDARYDEAVASYFIGMLHFRLMADDAALEKLAYAQALIQQEMEDWAFRLASDKEKVGSRLLNWITDLIHLRPVITFPQHRFVIPLYRLPADFPAIRPVAIPPQTGEAYTADGVKWSCTLLDEAMPLCPWGRRYFALPLDEEDSYPAIPDGRKGDLIVMEWLVPQPLNAQSIFAVYRFHRYPNGRIVWDNAEAIELKLWGMPRMHCHPISPALAGPRSSPAGGL